MGSDDPRNLQRYGLRLDVDGALAFAQPRGAALHRAPSRLAAGDSNLGTPVTRCAWPNCESDEDYRSVCDRHYQSAKRHGVPLPEIRALTEFERFEALVDRSGGPDVCHPWTGTCDEDGYGRFVASRGRRAPRYAYRWYVGGLADDEVVRHKCDNPPCVNPNHLISGSSLDNTQDMLDRGRQLRGSAHPMAIVTEEIVRDIRARYVPRKVTLKVLGQEYGLSEGAIHAIITRRNWSHVA